MARWSLCCNMGKRVLLISEDLPLPETPVTQMSVPRGSSTVTCLRLLPEAPTRRIVLPLPWRRTVGTASLRSPRR